MAAITLKNVFCQTQEELINSLEGLQLPREYDNLQHIVNEHIKKLLISDNEFKNSLNASDAEMLSHALRVALSLQRVSLVSCFDFKTLSIQSKFNVDEINKKDNEVVENALSLLPTVICAFVNPWLAMAVGIGTVGIKKICIKKTHENSVKINEVKEDISRTITNEEIQIIITGIESLCDEIDAIIAKIQRDRRDVTSQMKIKLDDCVIETMYPQILISLQYLVMEDIKREIKSQYIQNLLFSLQGYGYEVVEYSASNSDFFIKKQNPRVEQETMYLPAIVKDIDGTKITALQGIVYIPQNCNK